MTCWLQYKFVYFVSHSLWCNTDTLAAAVKKYFVTFPQRPFFLFLILKKTINKTFKKHVDIIKYHKKD